MLRPYRPRRHLPGIITCHNSYLLPHLMPRNRARCLQYRALLPNVYIIGLFSCVTSCATRGARTHLYIPVRRPVAIVCLAASGISQTHAPVAKHTTRGLDRQFCLAADEGQCHGMVLVGEARQTDRGTSISAPTLWACPGGRGE